MFEVNFLDQWFDVKVNDMKEKAVEIQLPQCFLCNKPIRTTQRYGAVAKQALLDVQKVKVKLHGDPMELENKRQQLALAIELKFDGLAAKNVGFAIEAKRVVLELVTKPDMQHLDKNRLANLDTITRFLEQMVAFRVKDVDKLRRIAYRLPEDIAYEAVFGDRHQQVVQGGPFGPSAARFVEQFYGQKNPTSSDHWGSTRLWQILDNEVESLFKWIIDNAKAPSAQMVEEFGCEWRRTVVFAQLIEFLIIVTDKGQTVSHEDWISVEDLMKLVNGEKAFYPDIEKVAMEMIGRLMTKYGTKSGLGISEKERIQIIQAVGLSPGHWFKCRNGHIYLITECGGATQEAKCPDCGAGIGGASHHLLADNAVATEMDGATQGAYEARVVGDLEFARRLQEQLNGIGNAFGW